MIYVLCEIEKYVGYLSNHTVINHKTMIFDEIQCRDGIHAVRDSSKNTSFGRDISRPYFISHKAWYWLL